MQLSASVGRSVIVMCQMHGIEWSTIMPLPSKDWLLLVLRCAAGQNTCAHSFMHMLA